MICRIPGQKPGLVSKTLITWTDITPTLLDYAGAAGPKYALHGKSFLPAISDAGWKGPENVFLSHTFHEVTMYYPMRTIRTQRHKLIVNLAGNLPFPFASDLYGSPTWQGALKRQHSHYGNRSVSALLQRPRFELYDIEADPSEIHNLAEKPEHAPTLAKLLAELKQYQKQTNDPWLLKYERE
jgi:N-sulfoglucosamine sulfohydrolase